MDLQVVSICKILKLFYLFVLCLNQWSGHCCSGECLFIKRQFSSVFDLTNQRPFDALLCWFSWNLCLFNEISFSCLQGKQSSVHAPKAWLTHKQIAKPQVVQKVLPLWFFSQRNRSNGSLILFLSLIIEVLTVIKESVCGSHLCVWTLFQQENTAQVNHLTLGVSVIVEILASESPASYKIFRC